MTSRQTFWVVLAYSWTAFITVVLAGGGDGGGVEIALYAIFLGLVLLDWITYVRTHPDADLWLATGGRSILVACLAVAPAWILDRILG